MRVGIDVGGTNTDAVVMDGATVVSSAKRPTSDDVSSGIRAALRAALDEAPRAAASSIDAVMIGTTQFTNAVVERARLSRVGALRIGLPASASLPPAVDWPDDLRRVVDPMVAMVEGGHEYDGRPIAPLDRRAVREAATRMRDAGIRAVAITAVFSPLTSEAERAAADLVREVMPEADLTLSSDLGRVGLLERENVTLLNAALVGLARRVVDGFARALVEETIHAPLFLTLNDGTVATAESAAETPVYGFASGPTNSMRGAALLSGLTEAVVIDVGGTTSDVGHLVGGFPRQANNVVEVGGVRTLFRMPDLLTLPLGGGSEVGADGSVGPRSVGHALGREALVFGGGCTTATDVAVAAGRVAVGDASRAVVPDDVVDRVLATSRRMLAAAVDAVKHGPAPVDVVAVGGGAFLVPDDFDGAAQIHRVPRADVANAVGAAMAQVAGQVDQVFSGTTREAALAIARELAVSRAVEAGAAPSTVEIVEVEDLPLSYVPGDARRVRVRAVGDIAAVSRASAPA